jgi:zinc protease
VTSSATAPAPAENLKPSTAKIVLDNGLTLLVYRTPGQPAVSLTAVMKAGQTFETPDNSGVSFMAASYLTRGTATRSEEQIAEFFDSIGGSIGAASGWNSIYLRSLVLKPDFSSALKVFADILQHPAFMPDLLPAVQEDQKAALGAAQTSAAGNCAMFFSEQFFPGSPYRFPATGSAAAIKHLTADAVRDFYQRFAIAKNLVLVVAGDVDPAQVEALIKAEFAKLSAGDKIETPTPLPEAKVERAQKEIFIQKVDKKGAVIMVGYPGLDLDNLRDRLPMEIFQTLISNPSMPRSLHNVIRGQSLAYGAYFNGRPGLLPGFYRAEALDCQSENATRVARLLIDMVQAAHDTAFTDDDLRDARDLLLTGRQLARQTPEEVAFEMALNELYGFGYDFEEKYPARLAAVTPDDIKRVINTYLNNPMICISTPDPDKVDQAELRRPYDAAKLKEMIDKTPTEIPLNKPSDLQAK